MQLDEPIDYVTSQRRYSNGVDWRHAACAEIAALACSAASNVPQSRRAWPPTHGSAGQAAAADDHWSSGGHAPRPALPTGQRGEVVKWTEGQRFSRRSADRAVNTTTGTSLREFVDDTAPLYPAGLKSS